MAIKGMLIRATKDESRNKELSDYIWSLSFKKPIRVDVAVYNEPLSATVSKSRYVVTVNPLTKIEDIKPYLLKKGYITEDQLN